MAILGTIRGGVVVIEGAETLPEGTSVSIVPSMSPVIRVAKSQRQVVLPLVPSATPGQIDLTNARIAEILQEQDASS